MVVADMRKWFAIRKTHSLRIYWFQTKPVENRAAACRLPATWSSRA